MEKKLKKSFFNTRLKRKKYKNKLKLPNLLKIIITIDRIFC